MAGEVDFHALRQEAFAAALATPREGGSPGLRAHARAESVLIFSGALGAL
jgi:hypothetical protein